MASPKYEYLLAEAEMLHLLSKPRCVLRRSRGPTYLIHRCVEAVGC